MKRYQILIILFALAFAVPFLSYHTYGYITSHFFVDVPEGLAQTYLLTSEDLPGWQLTKAQDFIHLTPSMIEWLNKANTKDVAHWEYKDSIKDLYVWVRTFEDETARRDAEGFIAWAYWLSPKNLLFGESGRIGLYKEEGSEFQPLMVYVAEGNKMFYISYFNDAGRYDRKNQQADETFLVNLVKKLMAKSSGVRRMASGVLANESEELLARESVTPNAELQTPNEI